MYSGRNEGGIIFKLHMFLTSFFAVNDPDKASLKVALKLTSSLYNLDIFIRDILQDSFCFVAESLTPSSVEIVPRK